MFKAKRLELNLIFNAKMSKENKIYVKYFQFVFATFFKSFFSRSKFDFIAFNVTCAAEKHVRQLPKHDVRTVPWLTLQRRAYRNRLMRYFESYVFAGQQVTKLQFVRIGSDIRSHLLLLPVKSLHGSFP